MSGFAAIVFRDGTPVEPEHLAVLGEGIVCRGADGRDGWRDGSAGLVHAHFWTTPEETGERQPVHRRNRLWISADLRLDNREELCAQLDVDRRTATDAGIVLAAYDRWADDCPRHLVGDFAFALWDAPRRRLFCARDPLGIRPFYYALDHRRLIAASTLEAVLGALDAPAEVHEPFLRDLLALRFERWTTETPYRGVLRLPPAHRMIVEANRAAVSRYWTLGEAPPPLKGDEEHIERFRETFLTVVKAQLRSTGPVGFLVSGGLDSSAVACAAQHLAESGALPWHIGLRFYSCVFREAPAAQEREYAEAVARRCTRAHMTFLPSDDCWGLREFGDDGGYPLAEPEVNVSRALTVRPLRAARADGCKVVLTGLGGDQVLGGGPYHQPIFLRDVTWSRLAAEIPHFLRWSRCSAAGLLFDAWVRPAVPPALRRLARRLLGREAAATADRRPAAHLRSWSGRDCYNILTSGTFPAALSNLDIAAAEVGVETRHPFLDRRVVELLCHLPARLRFGGGWTKLVLRQSGLLPDEVRRRTGRVHFAELEHRGMRHEMRWKVRNLLRGSRVVAAGLLAETALLRLWEKYWEGDGNATDARNTLVGFLCTETWLRGHELRANWPIGAQTRVPAEAVKGQR